MPVNTLSVLVSASYGPGTIHSPTETVPANADFALFQGTMTQAVAGNSANSLVATLEVSADSGTTWTAIISGNAWQGGKLLRSGLFEVPEWGIDMTAYRGQLVRGSLTIPTAFVFGLNLALTTG